MAGDLVEALPASGEELFLLVDIRGVERPFVEGAFDKDGLEIFGDDVLRERGVAEDVAFGGGVQDFGVEQSDDVAQVEIAVGERCDVFAADFAEVAFVAFGHSEEALGVRRWAQVF